MRQAARGAARGERSPRLVRGRVGAGAGVGVGVRVGVRVRAMFRVRATVTVTVTVTLTFIPRKRFMSVPGLNRFLHMTWLGLGVGLGLG